MSKSNTNHPLTSPSPKINYEYWALSAIARHNIVGLKKFLDQAKEYSQINKNFILKVNNEAVLSDSIDCLRILKEEGLLLPLPQLFASAYAFKKLPIIEFIMMEEGHQLIDVQLKVLSENGLSDLDRAIIGFAEKQKLEVILPINFSPSSVLKL